MRRAHPTPSERGLSLLETSLALAILASLSAGIFMATRAQQEGFSVVLGDLRGLQQASDAVDWLVRDMRQASAFTVTATDSMSFTLPAGNATLRLGSPLADDPRFRPLLYDPDGPAPGGPEPEREITRGRILINHNPQGLALQDARPDGTVPIFVADGPRRVIITLVLQARPTAPVRYLRTSVTGRNIP